MVPLWRGSVLPLGCEAVVNRRARCVGCSVFGRFGAASQPSGSKLPRHGFVDGLTGVMTNMKKPLLPKKQRLFEETLKA